jgi:hypothetical protein
LGRNAPASTSAAIVFPVPLSPEKSALMPKPRFILRSKRHFDCRDTANQTPSRSHDAAIRVYDEAGNVIETHEHKGDFKE